MSIRNEYMDDIVGQRTGYKTRYSGRLVGWGHWIRATVSFHLELSFDHAYHKRVYDCGANQSQLMLAGDLIFFF